MKFDIPQGDIAVDSERHGVHELGGVGNQSEECQAKELLIDVDAFKYDVYYVHQDFWRVSSAQNDPQVKGSRTGNHGKENGAAKQDSRADPSVPIGRLMPASFTFIVLLSGRTDVVDSRFVT